MTGSIRDRFNLAGKVAIVTGASRGIGAAIAHGLAEFGARVMLSSRRQDAVEAVAREILAAGGTASACAAHVGNPQDLAILLERTIAEFGGVDILVNNAATNPVLAPVALTDEAAFDKIIGVNLKGPLLLSQRVFPIMAERGGGSIINIASSGGLRPEPMLGIYSVSKAALVSLTQVMAAEWGAAGVHVNVICPGLVQTKFSHALWADEGNLQRFLERVPLGRIAQPEEIAPLAVFLASDAAAYCTGGVFVADGGYTV